MILNDLPNKTNKFLKLNQIILKNKIVKISAIICTYNRERYLKQCLEACTTQTLPKDQFEIVVINNNSTDNTEHVCKEFTQKYPEYTFSYFVETEQGLSPARNRGVKESKAEYITFLDDDAFIANDFLEITVNFLDNNRNVAAVGGKILLHYEGSIPKWGNKYLNSLLGYFNLGDVSKPFPKKYYPRGSNMSFRKELFDKYGFFNTNLGRKGGNLVGSEEKELFERFSKQNIGIHYIHNAIVYHCVPESRTTKDFIKKQAIGTGIGERSRMNNYSVVQKLLYIKNETKNWIGSIVLFIIYMLKAEPYKAYMIIMFRAWLFYGLNFVKKQEKI